MFFSSIPRPEEIYRFRSIDSLIGSHKELYRQTIYLARPDQLNDVAEDTVNVVWQGDDTLWSNLIAYYWRALVLSTITGQVCLPGYTYISKESSLDTLWVESEANQLAENYKDSKSKIVEELMQDQQPVTNYAFEDRLRRLTPNRIRTLFDPLTPPYNDFPSKFVQMMGKMLLSEYGVACFTKNFTNPFLWTTYADNNMGVCLVFDKESLIRLQAPEHTFGVELEDIEYELTKPDIEFFSNLPKLSGAEYTRLFTDENGKISPLCPFLPEDKIDRNATFERRRQISRENILTKQKYWEIEQEVRMFSLSNFFDGQFDGEPSTHTVQYPLKALKGIIFGSRTTDEAKQDILEVILAKHYSSPLREDFWFTIAVHQPDGSVHRRPYSPYVSWRHDFTYPRRRRF